MVAEKRGRRRCRETEVQESGGDGGRSSGNMVAAREKREMEVQVAAREKRNGAGKKKREMVCDLNPN